MDLKGDHNNRGDAPGERTRVEYRNEGNRHHSANEPYNETRGSHPYSPGNEPYNETKVRPTTRRSLPNTPDDETLVNLDK